MERVDIGNLIPFLCHIYHFISLEPVLIEGQRPSGSEQAIYQVTSQVMSQVMSQVTIGNLSCVNLLKRIQLQYF